MKEELKKIIADFLMETEPRRTAWHGDYVILNPPTFEDFIHWLLN